MVKRFVEQQFSSRGARLRCDGEPTTLACGEKLKKIFLLQNVLFRTLEEQVKVMRLDFEKRTGTELQANSCLWLWLIHAGWVDARFRVKTNGAAPYQDACDSTHSSELLPFGDLVLFHA